MRLFIILLSIAGVVVANQAWSASTFSWLPNAEADLAGYRIYQNNVATDVGMVDIVNGRVHYTYAETPTTPTRFYATAYNTSGLESDHSKTVIFPPYRKIGTRGGAASFQ